MRNKSLKFKILITIVTLTISSLGIFSYLTFSSYKKDKLAYVYDHLASEVQSNAMLIRSTIENYDFFLGTIVTGIDSNSKQLPVMTQKYLESKPNVLGLYYHIPDKANFSQVALHQEKSWAMNGLQWDELLKKEAGLSLVEGKKGYFLLKKPLSIEGGFAAVVFRNQEMIDTLISTAGRYSFVLKGASVFTKEALNVDASDLNNIKSKVNQSKGAFGLFESTIGSEKYFATYSRLHVDDMILVNLIQEKNVLLIQEVLIKQVTMFLLLMGSISLLIGTLISRGITWRLDDLTHAASELENENFDYIVVTDSGDELGMLGNAFNAMSGKIRTMMARLREYNTELELMVDERTKELKKLSDIQNAMLNSLGQGFVIVDKDHHILPVYSKAAVDMFEIIPSEHAPSDIMGIKQEEAEPFKEFFDLVFNQVLEFDDMVQMNPDFRTNSKDQKIQLNYAPIKNSESGELEYVLLIGTDKTAEMENIEKFKKEWNFSQMITKVVSNRFSLNKVISESFKMLESSIEALESQKLYAVKDIQRYVHTVKGSFSYFNIQEVTFLANELEEFLEPFYETKQIEAELQVTILEKINSIQVSIECYIDRFDEIIQYKNSSDFKTIPVKNLEKFGEVLEHGHKDLVQQYRDQFYFTEVQPFFQMYPNLVKDLALKLNKKINFKLEGAELQLPELPWEELFSQFIHFVRNSADHGVESESDRLAAGKDAAGEISFSFHMKDDKLEIKLSDDGRGIDWQKIAAKDPTVTTEEEAIARIMLGGVSSRDEVSEVSGRGVGVSAIYSVAQRWNCEISVKNEPGKGFSLILNVPLKNVAQLKNVA